MTIQTALKISSYILLAAVSIGATWMFAQHKQTVQLIEITQEQERLEAIEAPVAIVATPARFQQGLSAPQKERRREIENQVGPTKPVIQIEAETAPQTTSCGNLSMRCAVTALQAQQGNITVVGEGVVLIDGKEIVRSPFTYTKILVPSIDASRVKWGIAPIASFSQHGIAYGGLLLSPTKQIGPIQVSAAMGGTVSNFNQALIGLQFRW